MSIAPGTASQARETYRKRTLVVIWWVWLAFALINVIDLAIQWHHRSSLVIGAVLALVTGVTFACALRPQLIADAKGITIRNPLRDCIVPWAAVRYVDVGEAVQVHYRLADGAEKVFPSWAMFASSRSRLKADIRGRNRAAELSTSPTYSRLPRQAREAMTLAEVELVARQLDERAQQVRKAGAPTGHPTLEWAWLPIAAIGVPAIALLVLIVT